MTVAALFGATEPGLAAEEQDAPVSGGEEVRGGLEGAAPVVVVDHGRRDAGGQRRPSDQYESGPGGVEGLGVRSHAAVVGVVGDRSADEEDRGGVLLPHELDQVVLASGVAVGGADQAQPAPAGGLLFHAGGDMSQ
jgi:hypothetical protein